jgi:serine/threonine-protein kinase RsbW
MTTLLFTGGYDNLVKIAEFVKSAAKEAGLDDAGIYAVDAAVDEACTNIIEHGYKCEGGGDIECTCEITNKGLKIILKDRCQLFDPAQIPDPDVKAPLKDRRSQGLGLYFIRKLMDEVVFDYEPEVGNVLTLIKLKEK